MTIIGAGVGFGQGKVGTFPTSLIGTLTPFIGEAQLRAAVVAHAQLGGDLAPFTGAVGLKATLTKGLELQGQLAPFTGGVQASQGAPAKLALTGSLLPFVGNADLTKTYRVNLGGDLAPFAGQAGLTKTYDLDLTGELAPVTGGAGLSKTYDIGLNGDLAPFTGSAVVTRATTLPAAPARTIEAWAVRGNDTDQYFGPFTLGTSEAAEAADPLWVKSGLRFEGADFLQGAKDAYQVHEQTMLFMFAPTTQDAMLFTESDNWNVKINANNTLKFEYKRSSGSYYVGNGPALTPNKVQITSVRKSAAAGLKLGVNQTITNVPAETSQIGFNADNIYFGRHANGSLGYTGNVLGYLYFNRALSDAEYTQAYNYMVAYAQQKLGVNLGDTPDNTPLPTFYPNVQARTAKSFQEGATIAGHIERWSDSEWAVMKPKLLASGYGAFRGVFNTARDIARCKELIAGGMKVSIGMDPNTGLVPRQFNADGTPGNDPYYYGGTQKFPDDLIREFGPANVAFVAGPNEPDLFIIKKRRATQGTEFNFTDVTNSPDNPTRDAYYNMLRDQTRDTWRTIRADPNLNGVPIIGIAFASLGYVKDQPANYAKLGDVGAYLDYGNNHIYWTARKPEFTEFNAPNGTGSTYGTLHGWSEPQEQIQKPGSTRFASDEGGSSSWDFRNPNTGSVNELLRAKYSMRDFLNRHKRNHDIYTHYEAFDEGTNQADRESIFGVFGPMPNLPDKETGAAMRILLNLYKDSGTAYSPGKLAFALTGTIDKVSTHLTQKRDGSFQLAVWVNDYGQNPDSPFAPITVANQSVTLNLQTAKNIKRYTPHLGAGVRSSTSGAVTSFNFTVNDGPQILEIG